MTAAVTANVLRRWALALPSELYDIRLVPEEGGSPTLRRLNATALERCAGWLRHANAQGYHVYGRPLATQHVLLDDLCPDSLEQLRTTHHVAAVVETSPWSYQAWVTVAPEPLDTPLASAVARLLARTHGADRGAASAVQVGRLPGLTNRKDRHQRADGSYPWTRLLHASAGVAPRGPELIRTAMAELTVPETGLGPSGASQPRRGLRAASPSQEWQEAARRIAERLPAGVSLDRSRVDAAIARRLLARGVSEAHVLAVVSAGPKAAELSHVAARTYVERTVRAARAARG